MLGIWGLDRFGEPLQNICFLSVHNPHGITYCKMHLTEMPHLTSIWQNYHFLDIFLQSYHLHFFTQDKFQKNYTVSDLIRGELKGLANLKYFTCQFWMVRRRRRKNQFQLKSDAIVFSHLKGIFSVANSTSPNIIGL